MAERMTEQRGQRLIIRGGIPLRGSIPAAGSKNAALYAVAAALLTPETVVLRNVPEVVDIDEMGRLLSSLGATVDIDGSEVTIQAPELTETFAPPDLVASTRASFLVMGPLLARLGEAGCAPPGGDAIGVRPLDVHLAGFRALGASVEREGLNWVARARKLQGKRIFLDYPSVLGTVNVVFAATLARGETTIVNAAAEPEVEMACDMLNAMGARIDGQGSATVTIEGVQRLHGCEFAIIPDRIEAGTYLLAGAATRGSVEVSGARADHLDGLLSKLVEAGARVEVNPDGICVSADGPLKAIQVQAVPYPGFATDLHAPMAAMLTQAEGTSTIYERVYDNRTSYISELRSMGGRVTAAGQTVFIEGPSPLTGTAVRALDIRAGAAVVIGALCADGETSISDIGRIDRGYSRLVERLTALGASIARR
ncbi:MAG: UDP-N-acetylglucosamine 1-carboxyvinyltransferase [Dehalococcoidia bacterium]|nr:UDP-N-acetylglucosamine 1-carboxyvinyltransferase [Dehalococcoidia bacterium]